MEMKIGYIIVYDLKMNPHLTEKFKFREAAFTRRITSKGDRVYSKMLQFPVDYEEIVNNANIMKKNPQLILTREPFLLDDELKKRLLNGLSGLTRQTQVSTTRVQSRRWSDGYPQLHSLKDAPMRQPR